MRVLLLLLLSPALAQPGFDDEEELAPVSAAEGRPAYRAYCAPCHGLKGDGEGPAARWLDPPPRDFTRGEYKWRSTASGRLPTDADLLRTIDRGVRGTPMPAWGERLPERTRRALVEVVKAFSGGFASRGGAEPVEIPPAPPPTPELIAAGAKVYERLRCGQCHGADGRGGGPAADTLQDSLGRPIEAHDFTRGFIKVGDTPEALYRVLMTGLDGTPMPAYDQTSTAEERWPLVHYTLSLREERGLAHWLFGPLEEQDR